MVATKQNEMRLLFWETTADGEPLFRPNIFQEETT